MGTIKILGFDEDGNAQRLKIRIARFLDYDPVTASDKSNIRSTLGITSQGGLGDLLAANNLDDVASLDTTKANLEIPDVGTSPQEVPNNGMLGSLAYQSADSVAIDTLEVTDKIVDSVEVNASVKPVIRLSGSGNNADGTNYGSIEFYNRDASIDGPNVGAQIHVESSSVNGAGGELVFSTERSSSEGEGSSPIERCRIDDSGRVGIGTASPSAPLSVESSSLPKATFGYGGSSAEHQLAWDSSKFNIAADAGNAVANSEIGFFVDGSKRWSINSSGNLVANSTGIDFGSGAGGTGTPAADGGLLNDFERGSFTPSFTSTGTAPTLTYLAQVGTYTKVGNLVTCHGRVRVNAVTGAGTGSLQITGLPFATQNVSNLGSGGSVCLAAFFGTSSSGCPTHISGGNNATVMTLKTLKNSAGVVASLDNTDAADLAGNCYVDFSVTYTTA